MKRLFIAINLPPEVKSELARLVEKLKKENQRLKIKWVEPGNLHLTLHFFGDTLEEKIGLIEALIKEAILETPAINFELGELGCFPDARRPKIIWLGLREVDGHELQKLHNKLRNLLCNSGFSVDPRPWQSHLTLGRVKISSACRGLNLKIQPLKFKIESIDLMESELSPSGPRYTLLKSFPLI